jgi:hypothetical protein
VNNRLQVMYRVLIHEVGIFFEGFDEMVPYTVMMVTATSVRWFTRQWNFTECLGQSCSGVDIMDKVWGC